MKQEAYLVNDGICNMLIEPPVLQYSEYSAGSTTGVGSSNHVGGEVYVEEFLNLHLKMTGNPYQGQAMRASCLHRPSFLISPLLCAERQAALIFHQAKGFHERC